MRTRLDHASLSREISFSWEYAENEMGPVISGHPYPEVSSIADGGLWSPESVSVRLQTRHQDQPLWDATRTDLVSDSFELTGDQPGQTSAEAIKAMLNGDLGRASDAMGQNAQLTVATQTTERSGFDLQPEAELEILNVAEMKVGLIIESGVDDVTRRNEIVFSGHAAAAIHSSICHR